jgi:signal transduction histidine kinase
VVADGHVFATLHVDFADTSVATPRVVRLLTTVVAAVGAPLSRALELEEKSRVIDRLERLDRLEKEFLAVVTHDMRAPLAVIAGFASSLRHRWDELPDHDRLEGLDAIVRNGSTLTRLVEQDLELALMDTGELRYEISVFDLARQIEQVVHDFAGTADARFTHRIDPQLPRVRGDEQRSWQVLVNLLSNAVNFSPPGTLIEVDAARRGRMVQVSVRDHGPGISRRGCRKVFGKFSRVEGATRVGGTGLGLYTSKRMVEAQGGRIWVKSRLGEGSTFTYTLPLAAPGSPSARPTIGDSSPGLAADAVPVGEGDGLRAAVHTDLPQDVLDMSRDRRLGDDELFGDSGLSVTGGQEP